MVRGVSRVDEVDLHLPVTLCFTIFFASLFAFGFGSITFLIRFFDVTFATTFRSTWLSPLLRSTSTLPPLQF
ncbi:hypothetical protein BDV25DRAFT_140121 [Aspergillus avenaceus]|uniref:Uncharacterized protein n=1 Tax=Aspergillus avenaceus TaxID=36643 RepID=A0A5N6TV13_ASPAV|nr:hypothetical protein BDV25DRAFT_140121 [Aspergillus avenaceus]